MKIWNKGFTVDQIVDDYTVGNDRELDMHLAKYDVQGSIAHVKMLHQIGIIEDQEIDSILNALEEVQASIDEGHFQIEEGFEDVHSKVEYLLVEAIGDIGKKIHTGRSRNDQVLVDLHLYVKAELQEIKLYINDLFDLLIGLADEHQSKLMPGYTHMQVAMPSSFGLWFSAFAELLIDDLIFCNAALKIADQNPLGSAAGYGSSFPLDRKMTTELLGFDTLKYNAIAAQLSRGKLEKSISFAVASIASTLSKLATDVCLFVNQNYNFISFPKELTTGSSIMPHKKNPDVFELMRAKCNQLQNLPNEIAMITNNLSSGYHRDFQLLKEGMIKGIQTSKENLKMCHFMLSNIVVHDSILNSEIYDHLFTVEEVNKLVFEGIPFRDAYVQVGLQIEHGTYQHSTDLNHTHEGSIGNLCLEDIKIKFDQHY